MAEQRIKVNCGFFDSINDDRLYSAEEMNRPYRRLVSNGVFAKQNGQPANDLQVLSNNGMNIIVKQGDGIFADKWFNNPNDKVITIDTNTDIVPRIDSIIVQVSSLTDERAGYIMYKKGTPASEPQPPTLNTNESVKEYRLANIYVDVNANNILQSNITDLRGSSECPWITGLIEQVDTSQLFLQYQKAYEDFYNNIENEFQNYYNETTEGFQEWFESLQDTLSGDVAGNLLNLINTKADKKKLYNVTIPIDGWAGAGPYLKTIEVQGIESTDIVNMYPVWSDDIETRAQEKEEYNKISLVNSMVNSIQITCDEETPQVELNVRIEVTH